MKPIRLKIEGLLCFKDAEEVNFSSGNLLFPVIGHEEDAKALLKALEIAFYGRTSSEPFSADMLFDKKGKASTTIVFSEGEKEYEINRLFKSNPDKKSVEQSATLQENTGKKKEVLTRAASSTDKKIVELTGIDLEEFSKRLSVDKETSATLFNSEVKDRIKFIAGFFNVVENSVDFNNELYSKIEELRISAQSLADRMELFVPKEGESVDALKAEEAEIKTKTEAIKQQLEETVVLVNDGKHAEICLEKLAKIENELLALETEKEARLDAKNMVERSESAEVLTAIIAERDVLISDKSKLAIDTEEYNKLFAEAQGDLAFYREDIEKKQDEYKTCLLKIEEYKNELYKLILKSAAGARPFDPASYIEKFYTNDDKELLKLIEDKKSIDENYEKLLADLKAAEEKLKELTLSSEYVKRISEASNLEAEIEGIKQNYNLFAEDYNAKCALRDEKAQTLETKKKELESTEKASQSLLDTILQGKYKTLEEAADNEIKEREDLYADYIEIEDLKIEISKFDERIVELQKQKEGLNEDLKSIQRKRADLDSDLNRRYPEYEEKLAEKNDLMAQYTVSKKMSGLEFGDECPFCKSLIMEKVQYEDIDVDRCDSGINTIKNYLDDLNANIDLAIAEETSINSAILSADRFIEMLNEEKNVRSQEIDEICKRAGVTPDTVKNALEQQIDKTRSIGAIMDQNVEFSVKISALNETINLLNTEIENLDKNVLPVLFEKGNALNTELQAKVEKYNELSSDFGEKTAQEMLPELMEGLKEKEILSEIHANILKDYEQALNAKTTNDKSILLYGLRGNKVIIKENEYTYPEIVVIAINEFYKEIVDRIIKLEKSSVKLQEKLGESNKNLISTQEKINILTQNLLALEALDVAISNQLKKVDEDFGEKFKAVGAENTADLKLAVLDEETKEGYLNFIDKNMHDIIFLEAEQTKLKNEIELNRFAYEELSKNIEKREALNAELFASNQRLGALAVEIDKAEKNAVKLEALSKEFNEAIEKLDKEEAYAGSEEKAYFSDVDAYGFLSIAAEHAGAAIKEMTGDGFTFDNELSLIDAKSKKPIEEKLDKDTMAFVGLAVSIGIRKAYAERYIDKVEIIPYELNDIEDLENAEKCLKGISDKYPLFISINNEELGIKLNSGVKLIKNEKKKSTEIEEINAAD